MSPQLELFQEPLPTDDQNVAFAINGLIYSPELLSRDEQVAILSEVDGLPWSTQLKRRVQHYGYQYDYKARRVDPSMYLGSLPPFAIRVAEQLRARGLVSELPDQLIVNEYLPGQGITAHVDCEPCFGEHIAMVSLGWAYEMDFVHVNSREVRSLMLAPGSVVVITGEARHQWLHQIKARRSDRGIQRQRRVSLTFRNVIVSR
jgi:alkylated DNA repair dioxygenase AlkB